MSEIQQHTINQMNELGAQGKPFVFVIDFDFEKPLIFEPDNVSEILWKTPEKSNFHLAKSQDKPVVWNIHPVELEQYQQAFNKVQQAYSQWRHVFAQLNDAH